MSIQLLTQTRDINTLMASGSPARNLSTPACSMKDLGITLAGAGGNDIGVWECSPGRFERQVASAEVMHILAGACTFTPTGGEPVAFGAGDTVFFPRDTVGVWDVTTTLRKVYVIFSDVAHTPA